MSQAMSRSKVKGHAENKDDRRRRVRGTCLKNIWKM